jgi:hypothetical protein
MPQKCGLRVGQENQRFDTAMTPAERRVALPSIRIVAGVASMRGAFTFPQEIAILSVVDLAPGEVVSVEI